MHNSKQSFFVCAIVASILLPENANAFAGAYLVAAFSVIVLFVLIIVAVIFLHLNFFRSILLLLLFELFAISVFIIGALDTIDAFNTAMRSRWFYPVGIILLLSLTFLLVVFPIRQYSKPDKALQQSPKIGATGL